MNNFNSRLANYLDDEALLDRIAREMEKPQSIRAIARKLGISIYAVIRLHNYHKSKTRYQMNGKTKINQCRKGGLLEFIVNRSDVYLKQDSMGEPRKVSSPLTTDILFDANENIGTYQLNTENQVSTRSWTIDLVKDIHAAMILH
jgi:hypothetical protein